MFKSILTVAAVVVGLGATAGKADAQQYKVWYKSNDARWDNRIGQWIRYNTLNDEGVAPNNKAWYEAAAKRLNQNYQGQGYKVTFAVGTTTTPPGAAAPAPAPAKVVRYVVDVELVYLGRVYSGYLGPYRSVAEAQQMYSNWAASVRTASGSVRRATLRQIQQ